MPQTWPSVSVIIPSYNNAEYLSACLDSVLKQDHPDFEILVVDDCSTDHTQTVVEKFPIQYSKNKRNSGASFTRNRGAQLAKGEVLVYLDSDVVIPPNGVSSIVEKLISDPEVLVVMGAYSKNLRDLNFVSDYKNLDLHFRFSQLNQRLQYLSSFFIAIRETTMKDSGGFLTAFHKSSVEDVEFGYRICDGKASTLQDRDIKVDHLKRYSVADLLKANHGRIVNMFKIRKNLNKKVGSDTPLPYRLNIFLAPAFLAAIFLKLAGTVSGVVPVAAFAVFLLVNSKFLKFVFKNRGPFFMIRCVPLIVVEYMSVAISVGSAIVETPFNSRYR